MKKIHYGKPPERPKNGPPPPIPDELQLTLNKIAQTEEMKRLLLKGEIVGFEWHHILDGAEHITIWYQTVNDYSWFHTGEQEIEYDSFESGIKVDDEWWFTGDKGHYKEEVARNHIIEFDFVLRNPEGIYWNTDPENPYILDKIEFFLQESKRIGNIHDKEK